MGRRPTVLISEGLVGMYSRTDLTGQQTAQEELSKELGDIMRACRPLRFEPARDPVDGAEQREGEQLRIPGRKAPAANAVFDQPAHAALELIAARDDDPEVSRTQRLEIKKQRRPVKLVENGVNERGDQ